VPIRLPLATGRNRGPAVPLQASNHARTAKTGQATEPGTIAMESPAPSWSVFDRPMCTRSNAFFHFAQRHPIAPHIERMWFASEQAMREFVLSMQLGRRNLDDARRALLVVRLLSVSVGETVSPSLKNIWNFCHSSGRLIKTVQRIARADSGIGDAFLAGDVTVREASAVAGLPAGEQREAVAGGADGIKEKATEVRDRREAASERGRRDAAWRRERVRPIPSPPPIGPRPEALAGDQITEMVGLEDAWASHSEREQRILLRNKLGSIRRALTPEQLQELAALWPLEPPAYDGAGNVALIPRLGDELKREQPRNQKLHAFCKAVESDIASRGAAQQRTIHG
jgi:hypothetical protein